MNFLNRAIKNVTRRWSKSVLLLITFLLIGNFVIIGLGISQAATDAKTLTRQKMRAVVDYTVDYDAINKYVNELTDEDEINDFYKNYPSVKIEDVQKILQDPRVKTANAATFLTFYEAPNSTVDFVHLNNSVENDSMGGGQSCYISPDGEEICTEYVNPVFGAKANYFPDMIEFADGEFQIVDGSFYTQEDIDEANNVVLVSEAFAELNGLRVGDTFTISTSSPSELNGYLSQFGVTEDDITMEVEVCGIYRHNKAITPDSENFDYTYPYENYDNVFLMPITYYFKAQLPLSQKQFDYYAELYPEDEYYNDPANRPTLENLQNQNLGQVTILLNDPLEVDAFVEEYNSNVPQFLMLDANNEEFERLSRPLDTLSLYANFIVWLVVINAVVIITLVTALTLKTREYEIGVLLSVGASKLKIVAQFFVELAIVAILGFTLSIVTGSMIANKVGQSVLSYQIESSGVNEENEDDYWVSTPSVWDTDYTTDISLDDFVEGYNVTISPLIIAEIYIVGLGIVLVSILIPSLMIMRFNPKRILMNQN